MTYSTRAGRTFAAALVVLAAAIAGAQAPAPLTQPRLFETSTGQRIRVVPVVGGLVHPWSVAFPDARTLLVSERSGRLRVVRDGALLPELAWQAPPHPASGNGLHFIALHPRFAENHLVFFSYPKYGERGITLAVARGEFDGAKLSKVADILVTEAWETSGNLAGRVFFAPDGTLLVTVGDRDRRCCDGSEDNSLRMKAQDLSNHVGKTLRIRDDGTVPPDNPFVGRAGARPEIYTYGHRNGYGLAFNQETNSVWQAEIGPLGGDEVNILQPGHNYGWPLVSAGRNYTGSEVSDQPWSRPGMDNPRMFWVPSISPSSLLFYEGDRFKGWKGSMFVGALTQRTLIRVSFKQPSQAERRELLLGPLGQRIRDVQLGPDGNLYVVTEGANGGQAADGMVLRIEPAS